MSDDRISSNDAIDAALHLDGDPEKVKEFYEEWARTYNVDTTGSEYTGPVISSRLLQQHLPKTDSRLLDAGCGTGLVGLELQKLGYGNIDGFDLSEAMARLAIDTGSYQNVLGAIDMMCATEHYTDVTYDAVLSIGVFTLGHVPPEALDVLLQLTRQGGVLVISTRTHYYDDTNFQEVVDRLCANGQVKLLQRMNDAPYNNDGDGHYWVFKKQ
ncbi:MAG: methyltransferase domain-containing protein [Pseudomonadota bacterium]